jgi:hypothetical protein
MSALAVPSKIALHGVVIRIRIEKSSSAKVLIYFVSLLSDFGNIGSIRTVAENVSFGANTMMPAGIPFASKLIASVGQVYGSKQMASRSGGV